MSGCDTAIASLGLSVLLGYIAQSFRCALGGAKGPRYSVALVLPCVWAPCSGPRPTRIVCCGACALATGSAVPSSALQLVALEDNARGEMGSAGNGMMPGPSPPMCLAGLPVLGYMRQFPGFSVLLSPLYLSERYTGIRVGSRKFSFPSASQRALGAPPALLWLLLASFVGSLSHLSRFLCAFCVPRFVRLFCLDMSNGSPCGGRACPDSIFVIASFLFQCDHVYCSPRLVCPQGSTFPEYRFCWCSGLFGCGVSWYSVFYCSALPLAFYKFVDPPLHVYALSPLLSFSAVWSDVFGWLRIRN